MQYRNINIGEHRPPVRYRKTYCASPTSSSMVLYKIYVKNIAVAHVNRLTINPTYYI
jgi:hypothetical protein